MVFPLIAWWFSSSLCGCLPEGKWWFYRKYSAMVIWFIGNPRINWKMWKSPWFRKIINDGFSTSICYGRVFNMENGSQNCFKCTNIPSWLLWIGGYLPDYVLMFSCVQWRRHRSCGFSMAIFSFWCLQWSWAKGAIRCIPWRWTIRSWNT